MNLGTCVLPSGQFVFGIHKPKFTADNFRENDHIQNLGTDPDGGPFVNHANFPPGTVTEAGAGWIYEIPNPLPFRGATYIGKNWADARAKNISSFKLEKSKDVSFSGAVQKWMTKHNVSGSAGNDLLHEMPEPLLIALATTSNDPEDLEHLANISCSFVLNNETGRPEGLHYKKKSALVASPVIRHEKLFEAVANNPCLPDDYKQTMVLRPGVQGNSEIVGEWNHKTGSGHVFEYLRRNSYIPWGHYAANMADDCIRYSINDLSFSDMEGMRGLYYQRTFARVARDLGITITASRKRLSMDELEDLRKRIINRLDKQKPGAALGFNATLWGWNFGFDYAPTNYRLHASHQQVHQQFAMIPGTVSVYGDLKAPDKKTGEISSYGCGDLVSAFVKSFRQITHKSFFQCYIKAIRSNQRMDNQKGAEKSLVVYEDKNVMLFVPKAQTSQWELQVMPVKPVGNIAEADPEMRQSLDRALFVGIKALSNMGAKMVTAIEFSKRLDDPKSDQHLLYCLMPKLPESPGAFSEAQLRWINGHYPEDFALGCRNAVGSLVQSFECRH